jgi:hypothetical protein
VSVSGRGQLSLPVVEAVVGVVLVLGVTAAFAVAVPGPGRDRAQLERYADDAATTLAGAPAEEGDGPFLARALASSSAFRGARSRLRERATAPLPGSVRVRVETPRGAVGPPRPPARPAGRATVTTAEGPVRVVAWYG